jgi:thiamine pyrophosphate-dependent acetolactate synthase large subunit-like protein
MAVPLSASGCAVVASSGDGGFNMKLGRVETARQAAGCGLNPRNT